MVAAGEVNGISIPRPPRWSGLWDNPNLYGLLMARASFWPPAKSPKREDGQGKMGHGERFFA